MVGPIRLARGMETRIPTNLPLVGVTRSCAWTRALPGPHNQQYQSPLPVVCGTRNLLLRHLRDDRARRSIVPRPVSHRWSMLWGAQDLASLDGTAKENSHEQAT